MIHFIPDSGSQPMQVPYAEAIARLAGLRQALGLVEGIAGIPPSPAAGGNAVATIEGEARKAWFDAKTLPEQKKIAEQMQLQAFEDVPYIPLGQSIPPTAYRRDITGVLDGHPFFWNVRRQQA